VYKYVIMSVCTDTYFVMYVNVCAYICRLRSRRISVIKFIGTRSELEDQVLRFKVRTSVFHSTAHKNLHTQQNIQTHLRMVSLCL